MIAEAMLVEIVAGFLVNTGHVVRTEVPNMGQSIDVVGVIDGMITAVEVKIANWRQGISQCVAHELVADRIVIAVGQRSISSALSAAANRRGYGVIHIDGVGGGCSYTSMPSANLAIWHAQRQIFINKLEAITIWRSK